MTTWTLVRFLHVCALVLFVGGQLMLVIAVAPAVRRHPAETTMRSLARRFGVASAVALVVLVATGAAMASHYGVWASPTLQAKLVALVFALALLALHIVSPRARGLSYATATASLVVVYLGVKLSSG